MPSVPLELGRYVTVRPRADGTHRVFFQVPARLRPSDWPSLIPLPIQGRRRGDLSDAAEVARIQQDARTLYDRLQLKRLGREPKEPERTLAALVRSWQASSAYKELRPRSVKHYSTYINHILTWAKVAVPAQPDPTHLTRDDVERFLALFDKQPATKKHTRKTLRLVMDQAIAKGWRADNPCDGIRLKKLEPAKVGVWEQADVDAYVAAADSRGYLSISLIVLLEWEIGQRLTDVRGYRPGSEYDQAGGCFRFYQSKTESWVTIQVSARLRELLNAAAEGELFLFRNERTGKAYTEERLSKTFAWVRNAAVEAGARSLLLRWLRHSCVVQLARSGCEVPEIAAVTGHSHASVARMLDVYLPRDSVVAQNAQRKRGLID
jgi:integrase